MIFDINSQLEFKPKIINQKPLNFDNVIVGGMGGSAMPTRAMFYLDPVYPIWLHNDYGLPKKIEGKTLFVAISYSGNTKETVSFVTEVFEKGLPLVIITSGGSLKNFATEKNIPHILIPEGLEPRDALVYMLKSLLAVLGREELMEVQKGYGEEVEEVAADLADFIENDDVLIYSSIKDAPLGYIWKIYLNESAKTPAFSNVFPEFFHNELETLDTSKKIILLSESKEFTEIAQNKGWNVRSVLSNKSNSEDLISNWILARTVARKIAEKKGVNPDRVPLIEEFKKL